MAIVCSTLFDHRGRRAGAVLTGRPIGELRRAYQALHQAHLDLQQAQRKLIEQEKMASLGRLVAGVAHELNNPISFVYGNIHTLERYRTQLGRYFAELDAQGEQGRPEELRARYRIDAIMADLSSLVEGTLEGATRISEIVRNLRRLSFANADEMQSVDLNKVIATAANWATRTKVSKATIELDFDEGATVRGNEGQFHQIAVNLIENALDAVRSVADPRVVIRTRRVDPEVEWSIADNGPGIAESVHDKIFEPFFTTKGVGEGTGLGLWICYAIVQEYGGAIVAANNKTRGALFHGQASGGVRWDDPSAGECVVSARRGSPVAARSSLRSIIDSRAYLTAIDSELKSSGSILPSARSRNICSTNRSRTSFSSASFASSASCTSFRNSTSRPSPAYLSSPPPVSLPRSQAKPDAITLSSAEPIQKTLSTLSQTLGGSPS